MNLVFTQVPYILLILIIILLISIYNYNKSGIIISILLLLYFFRNPDTLIIDQNEKIYAPCYGQIQKIEHTDSHYHVVVFLNIFDVHVQYIPINGTIVNQKHTDGTFNPAYLLKKSKYNEKMEHTIRSKLGDIVITQYAGMIARRIISFKKTGDIVKTGEPLGLIKFGSRVDIFIPKDKVELTCYVGQYLVGGKTIIGE